MSDTIFLRRGDTLTPLHRADFDSEDALQAILARYPDLLAGEQMNPDDPRRWLLIAREMGVPGAEGGPDRWSLDHLFVDQDAIPTLVEVKRASDTRIRREVAGQMLDYASNAVTYWPIAVVRASYEQTARARGIDPERAVAELIRAGGEVGADGAADGHAPASPAPHAREAVEGYWSRLETNLQAGRIRMVFVADRIPEELRRIVEFLNRQMTLAEVLAVELPQFVGSDLQTLVPRVFGMTAEARTRKRSSASAPPAESWSEPDFFPELEANAGPEAVAAARALLDWANANARQTDWTAFGFVPVLPVGQKGLWPFHVLANGNMQVYFQYLKARPPFDQEAKRQELRARLNAIPGVSIADGAIAGKPPLPLTVLAPPANLARFLEVVNWVRTEVQQGA